ncbi:MAG: serine hydrolase [Phycisphaeraceae bacterium]|nr:serine hydrolase [Phycisphaeraceae bacterium]
MTMRQIRILSVLVTLLLSCLGRAGQIVTCAPQDAGMSPDKLTRVSSAVQDLVAKGKIAGASVLVARQGKVAFFETFGMMNKAEGKPVDEDTIFRFYSMTKPVTSVAVMMLVEQGKVTLDDPVSKYIAGFGDLKVSESGALVPATRAMTVRDLLRHTSGLTYGFFSDTEVDELYGKAGVLDRNTSLSAMAKKLGGMPLLYQPGTRWHYSVSTDVLGHLVEVVSGETLDAFFQARIFEPLGMTDTGFYVPSKKVDNFAACYGPMQGGGLRVSDDPFKSKFLKKPGLLSGGGGLVSTMGDYLRFCTLLLNKGELDGKRLLRSDTVDMMTKNQLPKTTSWNGEGFGLGFSVRITEGRDDTGEYGWGGAASTHFWINPRHQLIVIALSQIMPYSGQLEEAVKPLVYESIMKSSVPSIDLWKAVVQGNLEAIRQHVSGGANLNAKEPTGGCTPLMVAALYGQTRAAKALIEAGANIDARSNSGGTALHLAALFCRTRTLTLLLDRGADMTVKDVRGDTALDIMTAPWTSELEGVYRYLGDILELQLDLGRLKTARPKIAAILREHKTE